jgi:hypothetical protein
MGRRNDLRPSDVFTRAATWCRDGQVYDRIDETLRDFIGP